MAQLVRVLAYSAQNPRFDLSALHKPGYDATPQYLGGTDRRIKSARSFLATRDPVFTNIYIYIYIYVYVYI